MKFESYCNAHNLIGVHIDIGIITWGPQAIMFINIRTEIRRNDKLSVAQ